MTIIRRGSDNYTGVICPSGPIAGILAPMASRTTFRVMLASCLALLVAGVVSVFTIDDDGDDVRAATAASTTTTILAGSPTTTPSGGDGDPEDAGSSATTADGAAATVPSSDPAGPGSTTGPGSTPTTAADAPPATTTGSTATTSPQTTVPGTTPESGGGAAPTEAGTYRYDTDGTLTLGTTTRDLPDVTTLDVGPLDGGRQVQVRDLRDDAGDGTVTHTTYRYADEGVYLEQIALEASFSGFGQTSTLNATAPFLLIPADAGAGTSTTGRLEGDGIVADVTFTIRSIDGDRSTIDLVVDLSGELEGRQTSAMVVRTADQLLISEDVDSDVNSGGLRVQTDYVASLQG